MGLLLDGYGCFVLYSCMAVSYTHLVPGVFGVDTRQITKKIRNKGTVKCVISTEGISISEAAEICDRGQIRGEMCIRDSNNIDGLSEGIKEAPQIGIAKIAPYWWLAGLYYTTCTPFQSAPFFAATAKRCV